jgi:transcriptional regulator with XRE-family HTH domain
MASRAQRYPKDSLGLRIYQLRETKQITLRALARAADISAPYLSDIEHDRRKPNDEVLKRIAKALNHSVHELTSLILSKDLIKQVSVDPEIIELLHRITRDQKCRCLVLDVAGVNPFRKPI